MLHAKGAVFGLVLAVLLLTGCSPRDRSGVRFDGRSVAVVNCGSWISAIAVTDADTGRVVWSARATERPNGGLNTRAHVELGVLPSSTWEETAPLVLEPRPSTWQFVITSAVEDPVIVVRAPVAADRVYLPNGESVSPDHFDDQTCSGLPVSVNTLRWTLVVALAAFALVYYWRRRRRRASVPCQPSSDQG